jgi:hypothetical protein
MMTSSKNSLFKIIRILNPDPQADKISAGNNEVLVVRYGTRDSPADPPGIRHRVAAFSGSQTRSPGGMDAY